MRRNILFADDAGGTSSDRFLYVESSIGMRPFECKEDGVACTLRRMLANGVYGNRLWHEPCVYAYVFQ